MRLIDADAFKDYIREACEDLAPLFNDNGKVARLVTENFCKDIDEQPTVSAEPKRGKWIRDGHHIRCDQCGMYMCDTDREGDRIPTEFCPHCGADMRGEQYG